MVAMLKEQKLSWSGPAGQIWDSVSVSNRYSPLNVAGIRRYTLRKQIGECKGRKEKFSYSNMSTSSVERMVGLERHELAAIMVVIDLG